MSRFPLLSPVLGLPLSADPAIALHPVATGLDKPVQIVPSHESGQLYIATQPGLIVRADGGTFLDLRNIVSCCDNGGLLSIVFHPAYVVNGQLFVLYVNHDGNTVVARYARAAPATALILFTAEQPKDNVPTHHGGTLVFGPDGMLYASIGDGGAYLKVTNRAQETTHLLGQLLRLNPDGTIPPDNPYAGSTTTPPEIYSFGLRNPWRFSFDRATGELLLGDVGQDTWEEIDAVTLSAARGANFGWPIMEGSHCFPLGSSSSTSGLILPKLEYSHDSGCSVTGGYRYRGTRWPSLYGMYFYGDYCSGTIWGADSAWNSRALLQSGGNVVSFGEDDDGELYVVDHRGTVYALVVAPEPKRRAAGH